MGHYRREMVYELQQCPACYGNGVTKDGDTCPCCDGKGLAPVEVPKDKWVEDDE